MSFDCSSIADLKSGKNMKIRILRKKLGLLLGGHVNGLLLFSQCLLFLLFLLLLFLLLYYPTFEALLDSLDLPNSTESWVLCSIWGHRGSF
jgi:hypothetical protein